MRRSRWLAAILVLLPPAVVTSEDGSIEVVTDPHDFHKVKAALEKADFMTDIAEVIMKPASEIVLSGDDAVKMQKLIDALEALDDVQDVYTSAVIDLPA